MLNNKITYKKLFAEAVGVYVVFCLLSSILLLFFNFDFIDLEELSYGDFPPSLIDNEVTFNNLSQFQWKPQEGSRMLLGLPVTLFFWFFPNVMDLKACRGIARRFLGSHLVLYSSPNLPLSFSFIQKP